MDTYPAISVIIPVYNVEKWIRRAVESLQRQTFEAFELLLVDDGSSDSSGAICDELACGDDRITVVHRENGGAASARNEAMALAKGITCTSWTVTTVRADYARRLARLGDATRLGPGGDRLLH